MNQEQWNDFRKHPPKTFYVHGHIVGAKEELMRAEVKPGSIIGSGLTVIVRDEKKDRRETYAPYQSLRTEEEYQRWMKTRKEGGKLVEKHCKICGKPFEAGGDEETCSVECQKKYRSQSAQNRPKTKGKGIKLDGSMTREERRKKCPNCGASFTAHDKKQTYCSRQCRVKYEYKLKRGEIQ